MRGSLSTLWRIIARKGPELGDFPAVKLAEMDLQSARTQGERRMREAELRVREAELRVRRSRSEAVA